MLEACRRCILGVVRLNLLDLLVWRGVTKFYLSKRKLESFTIEGDSPVYEKIKPPLLSSRVP